MTLLGPYMDSSPFWEGARSHRLMLQYCSTSGRYQFYPRPTSVFTGRKSLEWRAASGKGRLAAWTVDRISPTTAGSEPRIHAFVDLDEGARMLTWLVDCRSTELRAGMALALRWTASPDGRPWPTFAPQADPAAQA